MLISYDDLISNPTLGTPSLVGAGLLPAHGLMEVVGKTGIGKSIVCSDLAMGLILQEPLFRAYRRKNDAARGEPYFPVHKECKVLYFDAEVGKSGLQERMKALSQDRCPGLLLEDKLQFVTEHVDPISLFMRGNAQPGFVNVRRILDQVKPNVVIFDPLGDYHELEENDSTMRLVFRKVKELQAEFGFAAIFPHHESDRTLVGQGGFPVARQGTAKSRGHSSITQVMDTIITLECKMDQDSIADLELCWAKVRHGSKPSPGMLLVDYKRMHVEWYGPSKGLEVATRLRKRQEYMGQRGILPED